MRDLVSIQNVVPTKTEFIDASLNFLHPPINFFIVKKSVSFNQECFANSVAWIGPVAQEKKI